jgi:hypothetical protein
VVSVSDFELYRAKWNITEWRDGAVYRTTFVEDAWVDETDVSNNKPAESGFTYGVPMQPTTQAEMRGIRKKKS